MSAIRTAPFELNILSQALPASKLFFQDLGFPQQANLVLVSGTGGPLTVTYTDENGQTSPPITIQPGASYYTQNLVIRILTITGPAGATFAGAITWPRVVDPSDIVVSSISGKVSTSIDGQTVGVAPADTYAGTAVAPSLQDQLPAGLDTNGLFKIRYLGASDVPDRGWTLGSTDVPNRGWTLGSGDTPARSWTLGGTDTPSRSWTLGTTDTPTAYGSAGKAIQQDSLGNQYHVPVLQGTSTPINTKALQYDSNNYPLHTIGNVLSGGNGGDTVIGSVSTSPIGAVGYFNLKATPPAGYKWKLWGIWTGIIVDGQGISSPSITYSQWDFGILSSVNLASSISATAYPYWQFLQLKSGDSVTQDTAADAYSILYAGNGPLGWLNGNSSLNFTGYDQLDLHGADFAGASFASELEVTPNMSVFFEVTTTTLGGGPTYLLTMLPMGYQEPL